MFAQTWPSWALALDGLGIQDISSFVHWTSATAREEFKSLSIGSLYSKKDMFAMLDNSTKVRKSHIFIQSSPSFVSCILSKLPITHDGSVSLLLTTDGPRLSSSVLTQFPVYTWREVSHRSYAGTTTGTWMFGSSVPFHLNGGIPRSKLRRTLGDVLSPTVGCPRSFNPGTDTIFTAGDRAPSGLRTFSVSAPCVFQRDGSNITRPISINELMDIYDFEVSSKQALHSFWSATSSSPSHAFTSQAPLKVLVASARRVLTLCSSPSELPTVPLTQPTAAPTRLAPVSVPDITLQSDLQSDVPVFGMEHDSAPSVSADNVKAAKNDDASVKITEWDEWTVNSYLPSSPHDSPKICIPGSYNAHRAHFFHLMRNLMHRAYRRRLLRGFLGYIHATHGGGGVKRDLSVSYSVTLGGPRTIRSSYQVSPWVTDPLLGKCVKKKGSSRHIQKSELHLNLLRGRDCLERAVNSTFWDWSDGSSIFFWRWPARYKRALRDGTKLFVNKQDLPSFTSKQRLPSDLATRTKLLDKLQVPRSKRYILPGEVLSRTGYFDVPKGKDDIRIVYDATACGLNKALWSPNFYLPTIDSLLRNADANTYYGDIDLGEMFLNYALDEAIRPYAGVDVTALVPEDIRKGMTEVIERWERTLMGLRPSPYVCTQTFSWGEEIIRGNRLSKDNPLRWDRVILNLPGDVNYDPSRPWVYKWNDHTGTLAGSFGTYVDDIRTQNQCERSCRALTRTVAGGVGYLGQQDAPRKRRPPSQRPGAWSGAMCFSIKNEGLYVTCSQEKWEKGKALVEDFYQSVVVEDNDDIERSKLEKGVGFLVHLSRTFPALFPYFKGIYLTMESWREGRMDDGWKFSWKAWWNLMAGAFQLDEGEDEEGFDPGLLFEENKRRYMAKYQKGQPAKVKIVKRLRRDLSSLRRLFNHTSPPKRLVRGTKVKEAIYGFGDASGSGFGSSWEDKSGKLKYRVGKWGAVGEGQSSNWRELKNLVDSLKEMSKDGSLVGTEAFIFTDNSTAENAFFKGTSASPKLFELLLELRELEMSSCCKIHLIHVSGTRMIAQGSDGLSRGNFTEGSMKGESIFNFIPLGASALDRSPGLKGWLDSWMHGLEYLEPEGWFERGHDLVPGGDKNFEGHWIPKFSQGKFLWSPPPAAAEVAIEELRKARHKRQDSTHVFIVPRLMKPHWHKQLCKAADIVLSLPAGHPAWPTEMHEPLTLGFCFPYLKNRPWELRRSPKLLGLAGELHRVWKEDGKSERPLLQELWNLPRKLSNLSPFLARQVLQGMPENSIPHRRKRKRSRSAVVKER